MDIVTYALCQSYIKKTTDALGAVKGANCRIKSITHQDGINTVTFQMNVITANFDSLDTILKSMSDEIQALKDRVTALENA